MERVEYEHLEMLAHEAFIRRASQINFPFMLKGSYVTRQYFENQGDRIPADLDWVYLEKINDEPTARKIFNDWATQVTELQLDDHVKFTSFKENEFWRRIDYAMSDDFPTVNTDLKCWVNGQEVDFGLDVSFNLRFDQSPIMLNYEPIGSKAFIVPNTVPLSLQVSWKIHQTLVRPRFKDLFDLMHLVQHPTFDTKTLDDSFQALLNECKADNMDLNKLKYFLDYKIEKLYPNNSIHKVWAYWRHNIDEDGYHNDMVYQDKADRLTDVNILPSKLSLFLKEFEEILSKKGFTSNLIKDLDTPPQENNKLSAPPAKFVFDKEIPPKEVKENVVSEDLVMSDERIQPIREEIQNVRTEERNSIWEKVKRIFRS